MAHHPHNEEEYNNFKNAAGGKVVVVDFSATWCPPCKRIAPVFEELATQTPSLVFIKVDVDECAGMPDGEDVSGIPHFKFFKDGKLIDSFTGGDAEKLKSTVAKYA
jgi:thiol-disulfide isomerase/thioredoxin